MKGKTTSGFEFELQQEALDDYELLEALYKIDKGELGVIPEVAKRLLGEEQNNRLKNHLRGENGRVSSAKFIAEIMDIFKVSKELKN